MNAFKDWNQAKVDAHNARVAAGQLRKEPHVEPAPKVAQKSSPVLIVSAPPTTIAQKSSPVPTLTEPVVHKFRLDLRAIPAPRMTRRDVFPVTDKYPRRPCVERYFTYQNLIRSQIGMFDSAPDEVEALFLFCPPPSWTKKSRQTVLWQPHRPKPDSDNLLKAILDSVLKQDSGVWRTNTEKRWGPKDQVHLRFVWYEDRIPPIRFLLPD
jgi:Holliday junction resolvase RusA-like endonuclease